MNRRLGVISLGISVSALSLPLLLAIPGQAETADVSNGSRGTCQHAVPTQPSAELTKVNKRGEDLVGNELAASVTDSLRAAAVFDRGSRPASGLPLGLDQGVIGVLGSARAGLVVVVDETQVSVGEMRARIAKLSPLAQRHVEVMASCRSANAELSPR